MKQTFLLFVATFFWVSAFGQVNIDSLLNIWNDETLTDTLRLEAISSAAWDECLYVWPDSAYRLAQLEFEFAKARNMKPQMAIAMNTQGGASWIGGKHDRALEAYEKSRQLLEELNDKKRISAALSNMAAIYYEQGLYDKAIGFNLESLSIRRTLDDKKGISISLNNLGNVFRDKADHVKAMNYYAESLKIKQLIADSAGMAVCLNNIGLVYYDQNDLANALSYYVRSAELEESFGNVRGLASSLNNIGLVYYDMKNEGKAIESFEKALKLHENLKNDYGAAQTLNNLGNIYADGNENDKALTFYFQSLKLAENVEAHPIIAADLVNITRIYLDKDQLDRALPYGKRSLQVSLDAGMVIDQRDAADNLYHIYKKQGNTTKALEMHELYIAMRDSIMSEENQRETIRTEFSREAEQRDNEIAILNLENEKKQAETAAERNKRLFTLGISGSLILMILGGGFFFQRSRKQKHQVEITRAELQKNLVENDFLRSQLDPHFIKNALFNIDRLLENGRTEEAQRYTARFQKLMNLTLQNATQQLIGLDEELEMMEQYLALEADRLENRLIWTVKVADDVNPEEVELPPMILQPLVENALKHGADMKDGKGEVKLEVRVENERIVCVVEDNGSGISPTPALPQGEGDAAPVKTSHGLRITRERLEMFSRLNLADARLEMLNTGNGTRAVVSFVV